jgi:inorganic triphosphatase YgiF
METKLTLHVAPGDLDRLREHPLLAVQADAPAREADFLDTYFDTPELDLWKQGLTLRIREDNGAWLQTLKAVAGALNGSNKRDEWESALPDNVPQPALLARQIKPAHLSRLLASPEIGEQLQPVFQTATRRTTWDIKLPEGEEFECALDSSNIACGERHTQLGQLGLELKHGSPSQLFDLALALHQSVPVQVAHDSKAARGFALLAPEPVRARKAAAVRLRSKMTLEAAFESIGLNCLEQMQANVVGVLKKDVESLHQLRVGLRRLRALLDMFHELAPLPQQLQEEVDWLAGELGAARDWDVLLDSTLPRVEGIDASRLLEAGREKVGKLHKQMQHTLYTPRFTQILLSMGGWFKGRQWRDAGTLPKDSPLREPAASAALPLLRRAEKRLRKRIEALDKTDASARHRVRIAAKKARYGAEFFHDLLPRRSVKEYVSQLSTLQDRLGVLNDLAVAERLLSEVEHDGGEVAHEAAFARGYVKASSTADSQRLGKALAHVARLRMTR